MLAIVSTCEEGHDSILHTMWKEWPQVPITKFVVQSNRANTDMGTQHTKSAVIPGILACGTCSIELDATYPTNVIFWHVPSPGRYRVPFLYGDFHVGCANQTFLRRLSLELRPSDSLRISNRLASMLIPCYEKR